MKGSSAHALSQDFWKKFSRQLFYRALVNRCFLRLRGGFLQDFLKIAVLRIFTKFISQKKFTGVLFLVKLLQDTVTNTFLRTSQGYNFKSSYGRKFVEFSSSFNLEIRKKKSGNSNGFKQRYEFFSLTFSLWW